MFLDVRNACTRWLQKRGLGPTAPYGRLREIAPKPQQQFVKIEREQRPVIKKKRCRAKYSTPEERRAAMQAKTKAYWATVSPEHKAKRLAQMNGGKNV